MALNFVPPSVDRLADISGGSTALLPTRVMFFKEMLTMEEQNEDPTHLIIRYVKSLRTFVLRHA